MFKDLSEAIISLLEKYSEAKGPTEWIRHSILLIISMMIVFNFIILVYRIIIRVKCWYWKKRLTKHLGAFVSAKDVKRFTQHFVPTRFRSTFNENDDDDVGLTFKHQSNNKLIPQFLKNRLNPLSEDDKYYLILADAGLGKTTFLVNLFIKYKASLILPWSLPKGNIVFIPLGNPLWPQTIEKIENKENTILLLDALDEDIEASENYEKRINTLLELVKTFKIIILTCRTHFFPTQSEELVETNNVTWLSQKAYEFRKIYISTFDKSDIKKYLLKKYNIINPLQWKKYFKAWEIIKRSPSLMVRPILLAHIGDLIETSSSFEFNYQIYDALIQHWAKYESKKFNTRSKFKMHKEYAIRLISFSKNLAYDLYFNRNERNGYTIHKNDHFQMNGYSMEDLENEYMNLTDQEWKSKSFLNRTVDGYYKFSHKSILEYFLACYLYEHQAAGMHCTFTGMDAARRFYFEMLTIEFRKLECMFSITFSALTDFNSLFGLNHPSKSRYFSLSEVSFSSIDEVYGLVINNFYLLKVERLQIFTNLKELILLDKSCIWLYEIIYKPLAEIVAVLNKAILQNDRTIDFLESNPVDDVFDRHVGILTAMLDASFLSGFPSLKKFVLSLLPANYLVVHKIRIIIEKNNLQNKITLTNFEEMGVGHFNKKEWSFDEIENKRGILEATGPGVVLSHYKNGNVNTIFKIYENEEVLTKVTSFLKLAEAVKTSLSNCKVIF